MISATRVQILDETVCISLSANDLEKGMNPTLSSNVWFVGQIGLFNFGKATDLGEGNFESKPV